MSNWQERKDIAAFVQSWATVAALAIGGIWTYMLFIQHRTEKPKLLVSVTADVMSFIPGKHLVVIHEALQNTGNSLLRLRSGKVMLKQLVPLPPSANKFIATSPVTIDPIYHPETWNYELSDRQDLAAKAFDLEPGESSQLDTTFVVPCGLVIGEAIAYVTKPENQTQSWLASAILDFSKHPVDSCAPEKADKKQAEKSALSKKAHR